MKPLCEYIDGAWHDNTKEFGCKAEATVLVFAHCSAGCKWLWYKFYSCEPHSLEALKLSVTNPHEMPCTCGAKVIIDRIRSL